MLVRLLFVAWFVVPEIWREVLALTDNGIGYAHPLSVFVS